MVMNTDGKGKVSDNVGRPFNSRNTYSIRIGDKQDVIYIWAVTCVFAHVHVVDKTTPSRIHYLRIILFIGKKDAVLACLTCLNCI